MSDVKVGRINFGPPGTGSPLDGLRHIPPAPAQRPAGTPQQQVTLTVHAVRMALDHCLGRGAYDPRLAMRMYNRLVAGDMARKSLTHPSNFSDAVKNQAAMSE